jgi:hypothetical protein
MQSYDSSLMMEDDRLEELNSLTLQWDMMLDTRMSSQKQIRILKTVEVNTMMAAKEIVGSAIPGELKP